MHHLIGKEILRFHCVWWPAMCMAAGIDPPANVFVHGWLLFGGEKLSKTMLQRLARSADEVAITDVAPDVLTDDFGVDPIRYHLLRVPARRRQRLLLRRRSSPATTPTWPTTSATWWPGWPRWSGPSAAGSARPPRPTARWPRPPPRRSRRPPRPWERFAPHEALAATWRLIGAANALLESTEPWKMEPGPEVDAVLGSALEALRIVALLASPAMPATAARDLAPHRAGRCTRRTGGSPPTPAGAATRAA